MTGSKRINLSVASFGGLIQDSRYLGCVRKNMYHVFTGEREYSRVTKVTTTAFTMDMSGFTEHEALLFSAGMSAMLVRQAPHRKIVVPSEEFMEELREITNRWPHLNSDFDNFIAGSAEAARSLDGFEVDSGEENVCRKIASAFPPLVDDILDVYRGTIKVIEKNKNFSCPCVCTGSEGRQKKHYRSRRYALQRVRNIESRKSNPDKKLSVYQCPKGMCWHITHR